MTVPRSSRASIARSAAVLLVGALALTGCTTDALADQYRSGGDKNYIAGDGSVTEIALANRGEPIEFTGKTEDGTTVASSDYRGQVLVLNFWFAGCAPCRLEAPELEKLSKKYQDSGAQILGVNTRDQPATAIAFEKEYNVTYPSVIDTDSGSVQLAFTGSIRPNSTPTTLVLDKKGRIAARILGSITDQPSTLDTLIQDTIAEGDEP